MKFKGKKKWCLLLHGYKCSCNTIIVSTGLQQSQNATSIFLTMIILRPSGVQASVLVVSLLNIPVLGKERWVELKYVYHFWGGHWELKALKRQWVKKKSEKVGQRMENWPECTWTWRQSLKSKVRQFVVSLSWNFQSEWFLGTVLARGSQLSSRQCLGWEWHAPGTVPSAHGPPHCSQCTWTSTLPSSFSPLKHFHSHSVPCCERIIMMPCNTALALIKILTQTTLNMLTKP